MTNDYRTADEIERDISAQRAQMSDTINDLQKKFSVDAIVDDLSSMFRTQGGELGRAVSATVGRNPAAVALVGVGLAWLFLGQGNQKPARATEVRWSGRRRQRGTYDTWELQGGWDGPSGDHAFGDRDDDAWYDRTPQDRRAAGGGQSPQSMADSSSGVLDTVKDAAATVGDAVSGAASSVGQTASDLTARLSQGLEGLSEEARAKVLAARRRAHDARVASASAMRRGTTAATNLFEDQPLVVGALAVAIGAAVGGALPHSRIEDETLGDSSDRLFAEAQALFRAEKEKAMATVRSVAADVKEEIRDAATDLANLAPEGKSVATAIVDRAAEAANRVYDRASGEIAGQASDRTEV
jgi:hypothetical protein